MTSSRYRWLRNKPEEVPGIVFEARSVSAIINPSSLAGVSQEHPGMSHVCKARKHPPPRISHTRVELAHKGYCALWHSAAGDFYTESHAHTHTRTRSNACNCFKLAVKMPSVWSGRGREVATYQGEEFAWVFGWVSGCCVCVCTEQMSAGPAFSLGGWMSPP